MQLRHLQAHRRSYDLAGAGEGPPRTRTYPAAERVPVQEGPAFPGCVGARRRGQGPLRLRRTERRPACQDHQTLQACQARQAAEPGLGACEERPGARAHTSRSTLPGMPSGPRHRGAPWLGLLALEGGLCLRGVVRAARPSYPGRRGRAPLPPPSDPADGGAGPRRPRAPGAGSEPGGQRPGGAGQAPEEAPVDQ